MACIAELTAGMLLGVDLRKTLGLGDVFEVAANTKMSNIGELGFYARGIVGVLGQRAVAGFAVDVSVDAF